MTESKAKMGRRILLVDRFWKYVDKGGDCWLWTGGVSSGYGRVKEDAPSRVQLYAHRVSYEMANGPIPEGMVVDHRCHVPLCVNPAHLRVVTRKQNIEHKSGPTRKNTSGYLGVQRKANGMYIGIVQHNQRDYGTGQFGTPEEADKAVRELRNKLFTHNDRDR